MSEQSTVVLFVLTSKNYANICAKKSSREAKKRSISQMIVLLSELLSVSGNTKSTQ